MAVRSRPGGANPRSTRTERFGAQVYSPTNGGLTDLHEMRHAEGDDALVDVTDLVGRIEAAYGAMHWLWASLAFLIAVNGTAVVVTGVLRLLF